MKIIGWILWVIALLVVPVTTWYNGTISLKGGLWIAESQVNNMYERRVDLVPQVAAVVKKYAEYESGTLIGVTALRTQSQNLQQLSAMAASGNYKSNDFSALLASTMWGIKVSLEAYPTLKADTQFTNLYTTLEWSENRIRTAIMDYNNLAGQYNARLMLIPGKIYNMFLNFKPVSLVNPPSDKEIKKVPDVEGLLE
jgi:LemA protein